MSTQRDDAYYEVTDHWLSGLIRGALHQSVLKDGIRELQLLAELDETDDAGLLLTLMDGAEFRIEITQTVQPEPYVEGRVY